MLLAAAVMSAGVLASCDLGADESETAAVTQTGLAPPVIRAGAGASSRACGQLTHPGQPALELEVISGTTPCGVARGVLRAHDRGTTTRGWSCDGPDGFVECRGRPGERIRARFLCADWDPPDWEACFRTFGPK